MHISTSLPRRVPTSHVAGSCVKRSLQKRFLIKLFTQVRWSHSQSHTNNEFFNLMEPLERVYLCFSLHTIKLRSLPIGSNCLVALPAKMSAFNNHNRQNATTVTPLKICCHVIVNQQ